MASGQREYELLFSLQASLGSNFTTTLTAAQKATQALQNDVKNLNTTNSDISSYQKKTEALTSNQEKMSRLQEEHQRLQEEINATETPSRSLTTAMERNEAQMDGLNSVIQSQESSLNTLGNRLTEAGVDTSNLTTEQQRLNAEIEEAIRVQTEYNNLNRLQAQTQESISKTQTQLGVAVGATVAASAAVYSFAVAPTMEYEAQMSVVQSITNATEEEMEMLSATAKEMGQTTSFSAKESAQAMEYLGMAGWDVQQSIEGLPGVLALAAASGEELGNTADIVSNGLSAFGMEVSQSEEYADLLAQASRSANTDVALMGETFEKVGSLAGTMGYSVEDLAFATTLMASTGLAGSEAGTALKSSIANLASPTKAMQEAMDAYNISLTNTEGEMKPFKEVIDDMRVSFADLDAAEKASAATTIFGKEAMAGMLTIINASEDEYARLTDAIYDSSGAAQEMADIRLDNLDGDMKLLKSATESLQLSLGEALLPTIREITQSITAAVVKMAQWAEENQDLVITIVKVGAGLSALVIGILSTKLVVLQLYNAFLAVKKAMLLAQAGHSNFITTFLKIAPIIVAIAAVCGAIYMICTHLEEVREWIEKTFGSEALGRFDTFISHIQNLGEVIKAVFSGDLETARQLMEDAFGEGGLIIFETFETAINSIKDVIPVLVENVTALLGAVLPLFAQLGSALIPIIAEVINALVPIIGGLGVAFVTIAGEAIPILIEAVSFVAFALTELIEWVGGVAEAFSQWASENPEVVSTVTQIIVTVASMALGLKTLFTVATAVVSGVTTIFNTLCTVVNFVKNVLSTLGTVLNAIKTAFTVLGTAIKTVFAFLAANPLVAFIAAIVAVGAAIYYVCTHLEDVRAWIEKTFGSEALAYFDGFVAMVQWVGDGIAVFVEMAMQLLASLGEGIANFVMTGIEILFSLVEFIMGGFFTGWDMAWQLVTATWEVIQSVFSGGVETLISILSGIIEFVTGVFVSGWTTAWEVVKTLFSGVMDAIGIYIETFQTVLDGLIQFITGVFTGNWSQAWEGIKSIFSGVFEGIKSICSSVMNTIVDAINTVISGLNGLSIPDWVPGVGGNSLSIPLIPQFAKGTNYTPDTFIAGEAGAELITGAAGRKVFTAAQTGDIFTNLYKAQEIAEESANVSDVQPVTASEIQTIVMVAPQLQQAIEAKETATKHEEAVNSVESVTYIASMLPVMANAMVTSGVVEEMESGASVQAESLSPSVTNLGSTETREVSVVINSSPVFNVGSTAQAEEIVEVLRQHDEEVQEDIKRRLEEEEEDKKRRGYD